jgi:hypothetical protein
MPATIEVTVHDFEHGAEKKLTITLSDEQIDEAVEKQKQAEEEPTNKSKSKKEK